MELNDNSICSEKEKIKNISNLQAMKQNKSIHTQSTNTNNITEGQNQSEINNKYNSSLSICNFINDMPFENLNDYYDIESNLFLKRIEKLNLKFYWTSESILSQQEIKYPYNKLFLILFKQISLYIDEIARLNKQLKQKAKNEKIYQIKIAQLKQKEKEGILNKQMLKNLQRDNKLLEKKNEKNKSEIEKLNKKIININKSMTTNNTNINGLYRSNNQINNYLGGSPRFSCNTMGIDSIINQDTFLCKQSNKMSDTINENNKYINVRTKHKNKSVSNSIEKYNKNNNKEIINQGIIQCDEELEQLGIFEEILKNFKNKNINNKINEEKNNSTFKINYKTNSSVTISAFSNHGKNIKKNKVYNSKTSVPIKKNLHRIHKSDDFLKK